MCQHAHSHGHSHGNMVHAHTSRRDFFSRLLGGTLAGASVLEQGFFRAAWARAQAPLPPKVWNGCRPPARPALARRSRRSS